MTGLLCAFWLLHSLTLDPTALSLSLTYSICFQLTVIIAIHSTDSKNMECWLQDFIMQSPKHSLPHIEFLYCNITETWLFPGNCPHLDNAAGHYMVIYSLFVCLWELCTLCMFSRCVKPLTNWVKFSSKPLRITSFWQKERERDSWFFLASCFIVNVKLSVVEY